MRGLAVTLALFGALSTVGCAPDDAADVTALYLVPESLAELEGEHFLDHPFPSDLRIEDGTVRFEGFYNPRSVGLIDTYIDVAGGLVDGFSPVAAGHLRFDGPIDPASLPPDPTAGLHPRASVQLIDVDPNSPEFGARKLVSLSFRAEAGHYLLPNTLRFMPTVGFPLRPATRYALVVTTALRAEGGGDVRPSQDLERVLGFRDATSATARLRDELAPSVQTLSALGMRPSDIAHLAVFTTSDPTGELIQVHQHLRTQVPAPNFKWRGKPYKEHFGWVEYQSFYGPSPNYQAGLLPFSNIEDGGGFQFIDGEPAVVDDFDLRFSLSVPAENSCEMPADGYPIVLYAHGTGGSWRSYVSSGYPKPLADRCIAMMGVDQIFHGTRPGAPDDKQAKQVAFFNFENPVAARTNGRQSALDEVQRARLFTETRATIPASISHTGKEIRFDPSKVMFFGHSQGGLNGPLYLAIDDSALGGVLSGSGAIIAITLLEKTEPTPSIADLVRSIFLALKPEEYSELDVFHPVLSVAQSMIDAIDPINYARLIVLEPRPGFLPKSIYMSEGIGPDGVGDSYTPPKGTEAHAIAMGLPPQVPQQFAIDELAFGGPQPVVIPADGLVGNLAGGYASGVLAQWPPLPTSDGHFVVFDLPAARAQVEGFLELLAADRVGNVPAP